MSSRSKISDPVSQCSLWANKKSRFYFSRVASRPVLGVSDRARHKPGCITTEDGQRLEISDLGSGEIVLVWLQTLSFFFFLR